MKSWIIYQITKHRYPNMKGSDKYIQLTNEKDRFQIGD